MHAEHLQTIRQDMITWVDGQARGRGEAAQSKKNAAAPRYEQWKRDAEVIMDDHPTWRPGRVIAAILKKYPENHPLHASSRTIRRAVFLLPQDAL